VLSIGFLTLRRSSRLSRRRWKPGCQKDFGLPVHAATTDHSTAICIWEGPSVDAVRDVVESTVGEYSKNEYYEVELEGSAV
jgi:hypothetical protein